jgi:glucans biosynthesis protein C
MPIKSPMQPSSAWAILWDARGLLAFLGILLHSGRIYAPNTFVLSNPETHIIFKYLVDTIHAFRMEAFFVLSGSAAMLVHRKAQGSFIKNRLIRLAVPLLVTTLVFNIPLLDLVILVHGQTPFAKQNISVFEWTYWLNGDWLIHLWFIRNLLFYTLAFILFVKISPVIQALHWLAKTIPRSNWTALGVFVLIAPASLAHLWPHLGQPILGEGLAVLGSVREHIHYATFFALGLGLAYSTQSIVRFATFTPSALIQSILICGAACFVNFGPLSDQGFAELLHNKTLTKVLLEIIRQTSVIALIYLTIQLVATLRHTLLRNTLQRWAKGSYIVYLVHQPIIWFLALALQPFHAPMAVKFFFMLIATSVLCMTFNRIFIQGKLRLPHFLFTGKMLDDISTPSLAEGKAKP